jgi:hypothetical protein
MLYEYPNTLSVWKHYNNNYYRVLMMCNIDSRNQSRYPTSVVYQGQNGNIWSRPLGDWHRSMATVDPLEAEGLAWPALLNFK